MTIRWMRYYSSDAATIEQAATAVDRWRVVTRKGGKVLCDSTEWHEVQSAFLNAQPDEARYETIGAMRRAGILQPKPGLNAKGKMKGFKK